LSNKVIILGRYNKKEQTTPKGVEQRMETDFSYIKSLNTARLVEIINDVEGFEETQEAITELKNRDAVLALELGSKIIINNLGDDHLQGYVFGLTYHINPKETLKCLLLRKEAPGIVLFRDVLEEMLCDFSSYGDEVIGND
jgi:hypothetical protein